MTSALRVLDAHGNRPIRRCLLWLSTLLGVLACGHPPPTPAVLVAKDPRDIPESVGERDASTVEVALTVEEVIGELGPKLKAPIWTFNGTVPGPLIRVRQGDTVALTLTNPAENVELHDIDLHVVEGPGGGSVATDVKPGETRELRFEARHQGAFLYHCAAEGKPWEHVAHGMYGVIVVEPPGGLEPVDLEAYVGQSEWYLTGAGHDGAENGESDEHEEQALPHDVLDLDEAAARRSDPTVFTLNGHANALTSPELYGDRLHVAAGGRVRFFFGNAGPNLPSSFHVVGGVFERVFSGEFTAPLTAEETIAVPPGSAAVFELTLPQPGSYEFVDHALFHAELGAMGLLHVDEEPVR
ncbi:MAG TPA: multicopper oxidase domain-containing protein [Polyangiaceae bacterium]|nr:multicopper oxidase domain-containing protein [Polyangiaceae bacterium]